MKGWFLNMIKIYFPKIDFVITLVITIILGAVGGLTFLNDAYWVFLIYIISLGLTNLNKFSIKKIDKKNAKKRKKIQKKIDDPKSPKNKMPNKLKEIDNSFDYDSCFNALKFIIGMLTTIVLAIISTIGERKNVRFSQFAFSFYIDAFLLPLVLIYVETFMYKNSIVKALKELIKTLFYKNGKFNLFGGIIGLGASIFFAIFSLVYTMREFITYQDGIFTRAIIFLIGLSFLLYSFYNAAKQEQ